MWGGHSCPPPLTLFLICSRHGIQQSAFSSQHSAFREELGSGRIGVWEGHDLSRAKTSLDVGPASAAAVRCLFGTRREKRTQALKRDQLSRFSGTTEVGPSRAGRFPNVPFSETCAHKGRFSEICAFKPTQRDQAICKPFRAIPTSLSG